MKDLNWLLWLVPIVVLPLLAGIGVKIYSRPKREDGPVESVEKHERFRAAMDSQLRPARKPAPPAD